LCGSGAACERAIQYTQAESWRTRVGKYLCTPRWSNVQACKMSKQIRSGTAAMDGSGPVHLVWPRRQGVVLVRDEGKWAVLLLLLLLCLLKAVAVCLCLSRHVCRRVFDLGESKRGSGRRIGRRMKLVLLLGSWLLSSLLLVLVRLSGRGLDARPKLTAASVGRLEGLEV